MSNDNLIGLLEKKNCQHLGKESVTFSKTFTLIESNPKAVLVTTILIKI